MTVSIPLNSRKYPGLFALVDDEDFPLVAGYRWHPFKNRRNFYAIANTRKPDGTLTTVKLHRLILPDAKIIDHINHDGLDNRRENLREATNSQNNANQQKMLGTSSGFKGVYWHKQADKWRAQIMFNRKYKHLGLFASEIEAAHAYDNAARELFGEFAHLNFPESAVA